MSLLAGSLDLPEKCVVNMFFFSIDMSGKVFLMFVSGYVNCEDKFVCLSKPSVIKSWGMGDSNYYEKYLEAVNDKNTTFEMN